MKYLGKPVYVHHFEEAGQVVGEKIMFKVGAEGGHETVALLGAQSDIETIAFNAMFVNNTEFRHGVANPAVPCVLVRRSPKRQWKRGICNENTTVKCPVHALYQSFGKCVPPSSSNLDLTLVKRLVAPTYPTYQEALTLADTYISVALSEMFAISLSSVSADHYLLASHWGFIGECNAEHVLVKHPPALQEVRDFFYRSGHQIPVELSHA